MSTSIKSKFRSIYGYFGDNTCSECAYCIAVTCGNRRHYKCKLLEITGSEATDIRLKDKSCVLFDKESEE